LMLWRDPREPESLEEYWDRETGNPAPGARRDLWATRSGDGGRNWSEPKRLFTRPGYFYQHIILTSRGTVVAPVQYHAKDPGRNVVRVFTSTDGGTSWIQSADLDIGGRGNHDGVLEPTLVELDDGRIWMLMRSNLDQLYQSFSEDEGKTWTHPEPSGISSSSSPGYVTRLQSGRLVLAWNRLFPENVNTFRLRGGDGYFSERAVSWHRQELSVALSGDDGKNWRRPVVVARHARLNGRLANPYLLEKSPGRIWLFTGQGNVEMEIEESALKTTSAVDDFDFYSAISTGDPIRQKHGGWGWSGPWVGSERIRWDGDLRLHYEPYGIRQAKAGSLFANTEGRADVARQLVEPLQGEVWFSFLFRRNGNGFGGLVFNPLLRTDREADSNNLAGHRVEVNKGNLLLLLGQSDLPGVQTLIDLDEGDDHLLLGRLVTDETGAGRIEVWLNPLPEESENVSGFLLRNPPQTAETWTAFGPRLESVGVVAGGGEDPGRGSFHLGVLRVSDGRGCSDHAFSVVTGRDLFSPAAE
jgi:hypothetical protein